MIKDISWAISACDSEVDFQEELCFQSQIIQEVRWELLKAQTWNAKVSTLSPMLRSKPLEGSEILTMICICIINAEFCHRVDQVGLQEILAYFQLIGCFKFAVFRRAAIFLVLLDLCCYELERHECECSMLTINTMPQCKIQTQMLSEISRKLNSDPRIHIHRNLQLWY